MASGWVTYAHYMNTNTTNPITSFSTTWDVPPAPATNNGQTIFLFNGIEPASGESILQPVLQWGYSYAGGGPYWTIASWYVGNSATFYTPLINVDVGTSLQGVMTLDSINNDGTYNYTSFFNNYPGSNLPVKNCPQLQWATETLESYSVKAKSDYPTGKTSMKEINIKGPQVKWSVVDDVADGLKTVVVVDGSVNGQVDIIYPNPA